MQQFRAVICGSKDMVRCLSPGSTVPVSAVITYTLRVYVILHVYMNGFACMYMYIYI